MSTKISELPSATSLTGTEEIPIVQTGTTKKTTANMIKSVAYSTTEQVVGTWLDGKPLYRKVITGQTPTVSSDGTEAIATVIISTGETSNTDHYAVVNGWIRYANSPYTMWTMPYYNNSMRGIKSLMNTSTGGNLNLQVSSNGTVYNNCTFTCVVEYTKTADSTTRSLNLTRTANTEEIEEKGLVEETKQEETKEPILEETKEENKAEGSGDIR